MTFTADGKKLVTATLAGVHVWDVATGKQLHHLPHPPGKVTHAALAPGGATVATLDETGPWVIRDVTSGAVRGRIERLELPPLAVSFTPDGKWLIAMGPSGPPQFAPVDGKAFLRACDPARLEVSKADLALTPDGRSLVVCGGGGLVRLYDFATGKHQRNFKSPDGYFEWGPATVSADGTKVVASHREHLHFAVWDLASGELLKSLKPGKGGPARAVLFSPDARYLICAGPYEEVGIWDAATGKRTRKLTGHRVDVTTLALAPDGTTLATADADGGVRLWDWTTGKPLHAPGQWLDSVSHVWFSDDGKHVKSLSYQGSVYFPPTGSTYQSWDAATGKPGKQVKTGPEASLSDDGQILVTVRGEKKVVATNRATKKALLTIEQPGWAVDLALLSPDARTVLVLLHDRAEEAVSATYELQLWDLATGKRLLQLPGERAAVSAAFFSGDGRTLCVQAGGKDNLLVGFDTVTGARVRRPPFKVGSVLLASVADNARLLAEVQPETGAVTVQEAASGQVVRTFHVDGAVYVAFAPGGRLLAVSAQGGGIVILDVATGRELARLQGHRGDAPQVSWSADGKRLVSFGKEKTVLLWDAGPWHAAATAAAAAPTAAQVAALLGDLESADGARAFAALEQLVQTPAATVALLKRQLAPATAADLAQLRAWVADLDHGKFAVRANAQTELARLGEAAVPVLEKALQGKPTLELQKRVQSLLDKVEAGPTPPPLLRQLRALQLLDWLGTPGSRALLEALAAGDNGAWLTVEARRVLKRLP
jgi:WD40 repeat protein